MSAPERAEPLTFWVPGEPVPQGSMSVFKGRVVHQHGKRTMEWRQRVTDLCRLKSGASDFPLWPASGVRVEIVFTLTPGKTVKRALPTTRPDIDKLERAILDALTESAYTDDSQVVELAARKVYCGRLGSHDAPGARITIIPVDGAELTPGRVDSLVPG